MKNELQELKEYALINRHLKPQELEVLLTNKINELSNKNKMRRITRFILAAAFGFWLCAVVVSLV